MTNFLNKINQYIKDEKIDLDNFEIFYRGENRCYEKTIPSVFRDSYTQFKVNITNSDKLAAELVAFSNAKGGLLNSTSAGIYLTKAGSDKRKISPQELRRLFAESKNLYPDEEVVHNSSIADMDLVKLRKFLKIDNQNALDKLNNNEIDISTLLTNSLTVEKIKNGIAVQRNPILSSICKVLLPYTGYGSGIKRVMTFNPNIEFKNDIDMEQFKCTIYRDTVKKLGDKLGDRFNNLTKNRQKILEFIDIKSTISIEQLSKTIGISTTAIENNIRFLKESHLLKRVGKTKDGSWEIIYKEKKWN